MIDQFLDEILRIDPEAIQMENFRTDSGEIPLEFGFSLYGGLGYEKNILGNSWLELNSRKYYSGIDFFFARGTDRSNLLNVYTIFENTHFPDLETINDKREFFTHALAKFRVSRSNSLGVGFSYLYQLSFDADNTVESEPIPMYKNEELIVAPVWEIEFGKAFSLATELEWLQKRTVEPDDDFDRLRFRSTLKNRYGNNSKNQITCEADKSDYITGNILDLDGDRIENTLLTTDSGSLSYQNSHFWPGDEFKIRLKSSLVFLVQQDNGPGYYDYDYYYLGETFQLYFSGWRFSASLGCSYYDYTTRKIIDTDGNPDNYYHWYFNANLGLSWEFGKDLSLKSELFGLISESNDPIENYRTDSLLLSLVWLL